MKSIDVMLWTHVALVWSSDVFYVINLNNIFNNRVSGDLRRHDANVNTYWNVRYRLALYISASDITFHYNDVIMDTMAPQINSLTIVYSTVYSGADQRKHQSSASLAFVWGIHRGPVNSPHKWSVTPYKHRLSPWMLSADHKTMNNRFSIICRDIARYHRTSRFKYTLRSQQQEICFMTKRTIEFNKLAPGKYMHDVKCISNVFEWLIPWAFAWIGFRLRGWYINISWLGAAR